MKIILINPPYKDIYKNVSGASGIIPPLGIAYIASYVRSFGYDVEIIDANAEGIDVEDLINILSEKMPDILGISAMTPTLNVTLKIFNKIKSYNPSTLTVIGGAHASAASKDIITENPAIDIAVRGEGEQIFLNVISAYKTKCFEHICGITYRNKNNHSIHNPDCPTNLDVNQLPMPAYDLLPMNKYTLPLHHSGFGKKVPSNPFFMIFTGRGCPMNCNFCASKSIWGNTVRLKSAEQVVNEIDILITKYNIKVLDIADDIFTINKKRLHDILDLIIKRKYKILFNCSSRIDTIAEEDIIKLKKAGCYLIRYGVESGNQEMLNKMNKKISLNAILTTINHTKKHGIATSASYILGYPGETKESALQTIRLAKRLKTSVSLFFFAVPYKGTRLYAYAKNNDLIVEKSTDKWIQFPDKPILKTEYLSIDELISLRKKAYKMVYFNIYSMLKKAINIRNGIMFKQYVRAGLSIIKFTYTKNGK